MVSLNIGKRMDLIVGAGISGIGYANFTENEYLIVEKEKEPGGYCRTIKRNGYVWDYSGHFFHFQHPEIEQYVCKNIHPSSLLSVEKHTQIYYKGKYIDFPFQKNIHQLDKEELVDCLYDLFSTKPIHVESFKEMVYANLGKSIAEKFLIPYNEKLYACDLNLLDMNAMGRFFPAANKEEIILNFRAKSCNSYNAHFVYPKGGAIEYIHSLLQNIDTQKVCLDEEVENIDITQKLAITNKRQIKFDRLISTMPLPLLLSKCNIPHPKEIFSCNKVLVFNLGFDSKGSDITNSWIYIPEKEYIFYRLGYYDNIMNADRMSLYVEIGFPEKKILEKEGLYLERVMTDLRRIGVVTTQKLVDYETIVMDPAYTHISKSSIEAVKYYKDLLQQHDIYSIGRYGSWTYCSIEDNILEAKKLAQSIGSGA